MNVEIDQRRKIDAVTMVMAQMIVMADIQPRYNPLQLPEPQKAPEDPTKALFFDVGKFDVDDLTKILAENRLDDLKKKIAPFTLIIDKYGFPQYPIDTSSQLGKLEVHDLYDTKKLVEESGRETIIWMSPRGGNSPYITDRMTIMILKEKRDDGSLVFESRAICCDYGRAEFLRIGREMKYGDGGTSLSSLEEPDDLRPHPIGLNLKGKNVWEYMEEKLPELHEVWEAIQYGDDLINDRNNRAIAQEVNQKYRERMLKANTYWERVTLGAEIEEYIMSRHQISLVQTGGHGSSNAAILDKFGGGKTAFNMISAKAMVVTKETPGAKTCPVCGDYYVGSTCGTCNYVEQKIS